MNRDYRWLGTDNTAKIDAVMPGVNPDIPMRTEITYQLEPGVMATADLEIFCNVAKDRYVFLVYRKQIWKKQQPEDNQKPYKEYHMHILNKDMIVLDTTLIMPLTVPSILGVSVEKLIPFRQYREYKRKFKKCLATGAPQWVEYSILDDDMICVLIKQDDTILAHEASGITENNKGKIIFLLKQASTSSDSLLKKNRIKA